MARKRSAGGKLRIGDHWSAISIIAQSQDNPLKAVAEFVENSIDAGAKEIQIVRGRKQGAPFLKVIDDGEGIRRDADGVPDFHYVATHICDSIKKRLNSLSFPTHKHFVLQLPPTFRTLAAAPPAEGCGCKPFPTRSCRPIT